MVKPRRRKARTAVERAHRRSAARNQAEIEAIREQIRRRREEEEAEALAEEEREREQGYSSFY